MEVEGGTFLILFTTSKQAGIFKRNVNVIETGIADRREIFYEGDGLKGWYDISMIKWGHNGLVITFNDITDRKLS